MSHSLFFFRSFFVLSSCRFPFDSCIAFFAFTFACLLSWWRILLFCYFVSALHLPRAPREPEVCVFLLRTVFVRAFLMSTYFIFFSLPSLFRFRFGHRLFNPVFFLRVLCCLLGFGFCCDSFSILYTGTNYIYMYLDTYVR